MPRKQESRENHHWAAATSGQQRRRQGARILFKRIQEFLASEKAKLMALALIYGGLFLAIAFSGLGALIGLALLPLVILPALAYLAYWLIWQEFH